MTIMKSYPIKHWMEWDNEIDDGWRILDPDGFRGRRPEFVDREQFLRAKMECTLARRDDLAWGEFPWPAERIPKKET